MLEQFLLERNTPVTRTLVSPDSLVRSALLAVEARDPLSLAVVSKGISMEAIGLLGKPIVNSSGRFVWLAEGDTWPSAVRITPHELPFVEQVITLSRPTSTPESRLIRIFLRPSPAYVFEEGVTALHGSLRDRLGSTTAPLAGVKVQLACLDQDSGNWVPSPDMARPIDIAACTPNDVATDRNGEFAAFLRLRPRSPIRPDIVGAMIRVRLQCSRTLPSNQTRVTPSTYVFLPNAPAGRMPEGRVLDRALSLIWSDLEPL